MCHLTILYIQKHENFIGIYRKQFDISELMHNQKTILISVEQGDKQVKLPTFVASLKKQENFRKTSTSASLTTTKPLTV